MIEIRFHCSAYLLKTKKSWEKRPLYRLVLEINGKDPEASIFHISVKWLVGNIIRLAFMPNGNPLLSERNPRTSVLLMSLKDKKLSSYGVLMALTCSAVTRCPPFQLIGQLLNQNKKEIFQVDYWVLVCLKKSSKLDYMSWYFFECVRFRWLVIVSCNKK